MLGFRCTQKIQPRINRLIGITVLWLAVGIGYSSTSWPNEPAGSQLVLDCPFSNTICSMWNTYNTQAYANFSNAPLSPNTVFDTYMAANSQTGNGQWGVALPDVKELYVGTWWSTNSDFQGYSNNTNKMLFTRRPDIDNNFLVWQGLPGQPKTIKWYNQATYDNCGYPGMSGMCYSKGDGTGWFEPNGPASGTVAAGSGWHRIEFYLKASTTKTSRDGTLRWWLDGQLVGNYPAINLSPGGFQDFQINHAWDGSGSCSTRDCTKSWHHYWDHLHISIPNCGSSGCPAPAYLLINSSLSTARTGTPFIATLTADGGTKPYSWFLQSGKLPTGLSLNQSTGVISGTPTCVGRSDFTIRVTDATSPALTATKSYTIITSGTGTCTSGMEDSRESRAVSREQGKGIRIESRTGHVRFNLPQPGAYSLSAYDLSGREVWRHAGSGEAVWNHGGKLKKGVYLVRAEQGGRTMLANYCNMR